MSWLNTNRANAQWHECHEIKFLEVPIVTKEHNYLFEVTDKQTGEIFLAEKVPPVPD